MSFTEQQFNDRTKAVGLRIIQLVESLPSSPAAKVVGDQLLRSGTSIGANYRAACRAVSVADIISKLGDVEEETDESMYWIEMISEAGILPAQRLTALHQELNEILAMIVASRKTLRRNNQKSKIKNEVPMRIIRYTDSQGSTKFASQNADGSALEIDGDIYGKFSVSSRRADVKKLLAPIQPTAFLCIGLNYKRHAEEGKNPIPQFPVLFMKNPAAVQNPGDPIILPTKLKSTQVDYECELAVVIGKPCKNATKENALDYVLGYTGGNDVSARDWQKDFGGGQWCRGKTFDTFAPLGPALVLKDEIPNPNALKIKTILNGQAMQDWTTEDMIFDVRTLIAFLSGSTTLLPGSVIMTGTPHGVGAARKPPVFLKAGDTVTIEIEKIGQLTNPVIDEA